MNPFMVTRQPMDMLQRLKQDPVSVLKQAGYNVPDGMNNAQQIVNYLLQSRQVTNSRLQGLMGMMRR